MPNIAVTWNNGAANSNISLDLGSAGQNDGITAYSSSFDAALKADGREAGKFSNISIDNNGNIIASFTNGESVPFAKIAMINFPASHALERSSGNLYTENGSVANSKTG